jgi:hypothetical protein
MFLSQSIGLGPFTDNQIVTGLIQRRWNGLLSTRWARSSKQQVFRGVQVKLRWESVQNLWVDPLDEVIERPLYIN